MSLVKHAATPGVVLLLAATTTACGPTIDKTSDAYGAGQAVTNDLGSAGLPNGATAKGWCESAYVNDSYTELDKDDFIAGCVDAIKHGQ